MVGSKSIISLLGSANKYLQKAVEARENFYKGRDTAHFSMNRKSRIQDAEYAFAQSVEGKQLISDNKWNMEQAQTFSLAAIGEATALLLKEQRRTNELLQNIDANLGEISNSIKEMKVY